MWKQICNAVRAASLILPPLALMGTTNSTYYVYDKLGRLTAAEYPSASITYSYDNAGNRTSEAITAPILSCSSLNWGTQVPVQQTEQASCSDQDSNSYSIQSVSMSFSNYGSCNTSSITATFSGMGITVHNPNYCYATFSLTFVVNDSLGNMTSGAGSGTLDY